MAAGACSVWTICVGTVVLLGRTVEGGTGAALGRILVNDHDYASPNSRRAFSAVRAPNASASPPRTLASRATVKLTQADSLPLPRCGLGPGAEKGTNRRAEQATAGQEAQQRVFRPLPELDDAAERDIPADVERG